MLEVYVAEMYRRKLAYSRKRFRVNARSAKTLAEELSDIRI